MKKENRQNERKARIDRQGEKLRENLQKRLAWQRERKKLIAESDAGIAEDNGNDTENQG